MADVCWHERGEHARYIRGAAGVRLGVEPVVRLPSGAYRLLGRVCQHLEERHVQLRPQLWVACPILEPLLGQALPVPTREASVSEAVFHRRCFRGAANERLALEAYYLSSMVVDGWGWRRAHGAWWTRVGLGALGGTYGYALLLHPRKPCRFLYCERSSFVVFAASFLLAATAGASCSSWHKGLWMSDSLKRSMPSARAALLPPHLPAAHTRGGWRRGQRDKSSSAPCCSRTTRARAIMS